jgi:hypothetical protein
MIVAAGAFLVAASAAFGQEVGTPWTGQPGITETVGQIMAREALNPAKWNGTRPPVEAEPENDADDLVDRALTRPRPGAELFPFWPMPQGGRVLQGMGGAVRQFPNDVGPMAPQTIGLNVTGMTISQTQGYQPPDTEGAVGPTQILISINGGMRTLNKATGAGDGALFTTGDVFFNSVRAGGAAVDPRARFDRLTNRWFVVSITTSRPNRLLLAVSSGPTITSTSSFTFYQFVQDSVGGGTSDNGALYDYPSLGVDVNAVYTGGNMFTGSFVGSTGFVIRKTSVLSGGPIVVTAFRQIGTSSGSGVYTPMGVDNDDPAAAFGYFIGVSGNSFSQLVARRITNPGGTPSISGNLVINTIATSNPQNVPALGSTSPLSPVDDRLMGAAFFYDKVSNRRDIWTAHHMEVNASGAADSNGNRNGVRWYQVQNMDTTPSIRQAGTMFDSAGANIKNFWMGSVATSLQGHTVIGSSFAGTADRAGTAAAGRLRTDTLGATQAATLLVNGGGTYNLGGNPQRWGDYSRSCVDPSDGMTMWVLQEFCDANNSWAVRVTQLRAPAPAAPVSSSPSVVPQGFVGNVTITGSSVGGTEFFDPGTGYTNRLSGLVNGGGITVNSATFNSPTSVTLNITVAANAAPGGRTVTITNPDAQQATSGAAILTVSGQTECPQFTLHPVDASGCIGTQASFTAAASGIPDPTYQWQKDTVDIAGATSATYVISSISAGDDGSYRCVATNSCGSVTSNPADLAVLETPQFTQHPQPVIACVGDVVQLSVVLEDATGCTFQWQRNGFDVSGATSGTITFNPVATTNAGNYRCVVTNGCGQATSNQALVSVRTPPSISDQPDAQSVTVGSPVSFGVLAGGSPTLSYQWRVGGNDIAGATSSSYSIASAQFTDEGEYTCVVTNLCTSVESEPAALDVYCLADFNRDDTVDFFDYLDYVAAFDADDPAADINGDSTVDFFDYLDFAAAFDGGC